MSALAISLLLVGFAIGAIVAALFVGRSNDSDGELTATGSDAPPEVSEASSPGSSLRESTVPIEDTGPDTAELERSDDLEVATADDETARISRDEIEDIVVENDDDEKAYLVVVSGDRVGEMVQVDKDIILGRDPSATDVAFRDETVSSRHARLRREDDNTIIEDLDSANGTFINAEEVDEGTLDDGDKITLGRTTVLKFTFQDELDEEFQQQMYESSTRDQLTGALSKTHFLDRMDSEMSFAQRHGTNICLIMFDLDRFKRINDTYGHVVGDKILRKLGDIVRSVTRDEAMFARYGGEEFVVAERNTSVQAGAKIAERIRKTVADHTFEVEGESVDVTLSFGVADLETVDDDSIDALVERADKALYRAKETGRNCVVTVDELPNAPSS